MMQRVQVHNGVMNVFNFIAILMAMAIVFFLTANPFGSVPPSPVGFGCIFAYLVCP
jgi:hypothetical protein